jgi:hypothetical protein
MSLKVRYGEKMPPAEAKQFVDELYQKVARRWEEKVNRTRFMVELQATLRASLEKLGVSLGK